jgi:hypothetical protein
MDNLASPDTALADQATSQLRQEFEAQRSLFRVQPNIIQRFLESQARQLAEAILQKSPQVHFKLPDRVILEASGRGALAPVSVPDSFREQMAGGLLDRVTRSDVRAGLNQRLAELEESGDKAVTVSAQLIRYATASFMVHGMLPAGRSVTYAAAEGEEIPTIPVGDELEPESALTATTDAIAEEGTSETGRGELIVPYVPAARRFYLPQWVAFDGQDQLLVNSALEAEAHLASMQRYVKVLHSAFALAPYILVDEDYQQKRYGMLGQLINQGRALARYEVSEIIRTIKHRAAAQDLNRGLSLSLPYFDDQALEMRTHDFEVIPAGRIMFVPAFVVRSARLEQVKVAQDTRLSPSTRKHLVAELKTMETAFDTAD